LVPLRRWRGCHRPYSDQRKVPAFVTTDLPVNRSLPLAAPPFNRLRTLRTSRLTRNAPTTDRSHHRDRKDRRGWHRLPRGVKPRCAGRESALASKLLAPSPSRTPPAGRGCGSRGQDENLSRPSCSSVPLRRPETTKLTQPGHPTSGVGDRQRTGFASPKPGLAVASHPPLTTDHLSDTLRSGEYERHNPSTTFILSDVKAARRGKLREGRTSTMQWGNHAADAGPITSSRRC
jgi:hypothetical protein